MAVSFAFYLALYLSIPLFPLRWVSELHLTDKEIGWGTAAFYVSVFVGSTQLERLVRRLGNRRVTAVGEKFSSAYRGKARAAAQAGRHDPLLVEAMIDPDVEVSVARESDGTVHLLRGRTRADTSNAASYAEPPRVLVGYPALWYHVRGRRDPRPKTACVTLALTPCQARALCRYA